MHAGQDMYLLWRLTTVSELVRVHVAEPEGQKVRLDSPIAFRGRLPTTSTIICGPRSMTTLDVSCLAMRKLSMSAYHGIESSTTLPGGRRRHF